MPRLTITTLPIIDLTLDPDTEILASESACECVESIDASGGTDDSDAGTGTGTGTGDGFTPPPPITSTGIVRDPIAVEQPDAVFISAGTASNKTQLDKIATAMVAADTINQRLPHADEITTGGAPTYSSRLASITSLEPDTFPIGNNSASALGKEAGRLLSSIYNSIGLGSIDEAHPFFRFLLSSNLVINSARRLGYRTSELGPEFIRACTDTFRMQIVLEDILNTAYGVSLAALLGDPAGRPYLDQGTSDVASELITELFESPNNPARTEEALYLNLQYTQNGFPQVAISDTVSAPLMYDRRRSLFRTDPASLTPRGTDPRLASIRGPNYDFSYNALDPARIDYDSGRIDRLMHSVMGGSEQGPYPYASLTAPRSVPDMNRFARKVARSVARFESVRERPPEFTGAAIKQSNRAWVLLEAVRRELNLSVKLKGGLASDLNFVPPDAYPGYVLLQSLRGQYAGLSSSNVTSIYDTATREGVLDVLRLILDGTDRMVFERSGLQLADGTGSTRRVPGIFQTIQLSTRGPVEASDALFRSMADQVINGPRGLVQFERVVDFLLSDPEGDAATTSYFQNAVRVPLEIVREDSSALPRRFRSSAEPLVFPIEETRTEGANRVWNGRGGPSIYRLWPNEENDAEIAKWQWDMTCTALLEEATSTSPRTKFKSYVEFATMAVIGLLQADDTINIPALERFRTTTGLDLGADEFTSVEGDDYEHSLAAVFGFRNPDDYYTRDSKSGRAAIVSSLIGLNYALGTKSSQDNRMRLPGGRGTGGGVGTFFDFAHQTQDNYDDPGVWGKGFQWTRYESLTASEFDVEIPGDDDTYFLFRAGEPGEGSPKYSFGVAMKTLLTTYTGAALVATRALGASGVRPLGISRRFNPVSLAYDVARSTLGTPDAEARWSQASSDTGYSAFNGVPIENVVRQIVIATAHAFKGAFYRSGGRIFELFRFEADEIDGSSSLPYRVFMHEEAVLEAGATAEANIGAVVANAAAGVAGFVAEMESTRRAIEAENQGAIDSAGYIRQQFANFVSQGFGAVAAEIARGDYPNLQNVVADDSDYSRNIIDGLGAGYVHNLCGYGAQSRTGFAPGELLDTYPGTSMAAGLRMDAAAHASHLLRLANRVGVAEIAAGRQLTDEQVATLLSAERTVTIGMKRGFLESSLGIGGYRLIENVSDGLSENERASMLAFEAVNGAQRAMILGIDVYKRDDGYPLQLIQIPATYVFPHNFRVAITSKDRSETPKPLQSFLDWWSELGSSSVDVLDVVPLVFDVKVDVFDTINGTTTSCRTLESFRRGLTGDLKLIYDEALRNAVISRLIEMTTISDSGFDINSCYLNADDTFQENLVPNAAGSYYDKMKQRFVGSLPVSSGRNREATAFGINFDRRHTAGLTREGDQAGAMLDYRFLRECWNLRAGAAKAYDLAYHMRIRTGGGNPSPYAADIQRIVGSKSFARISDQRPNGQYSRTTGPALFEEPPSDLFESEALIFDGEYPPVSNIKRQAAEFANVIAPDVADYHCVPFVCLPTDEE